MSLVLGKSITRRKFILAGAAIVGESSSFAGEINLTIQDALKYEMVNMRKFGAKFDGVTDDTVAIQKALDSGLPYLIAPEGTTLCGPLFGRSGTRLVMTAKTVFQARARFGLNDKFFNIAGISDFMIHGNGAKINMPKAEYTSGEQRHAVNIFSALGVRIYNLNANNSGGDGFYVGGESHAPSREVVISYCSADNNRRQGLSVVNVIGCHVVGGMYQNTVGTSPECGLDIESNLLDGYYLQNVVVEGVRTHNNNGGGILVTPQSRYAPVSITVRDCTSEYDGVRGGIAVQAAMAYITGKTDPALIGKIDGSIFIDNITVIRSQGRGVSVINWTENAPTTHIGTVTIIDPLSNPAMDTNDIHRCALLIRGERSGSGAYASSVGNVEIKNIIAIDTRAVKKMLIPVYMNPADEKSKPLKKIRIRNITAKKAEWTSGSLTPVLRSGTLNTDNVSISYDKDFVVESVSTTMSISQAGTIYVPVGSSNFTLPLAINVLGSEFTFRVDNVGVLQVTPNPLDRIGNYGSDLGVGIIARTLGSLITLKAIKAGRWQVIRVAGSWTTVLVSASSTR